MWGRRFRLPTRIMVNYRRRLPHIHPSDAHVFLTWRLFGSLPATVTFAPTPTAGHAFVAQDRALERCSSGPRWLKQTRIADLVANSIDVGERERKFYELSAWVIMPNHVHLLIRPHVPVAVIMRWLKGSTAHGANRILGRTGQPFWQDESYDHYARTSAERNRIIGYIEANPVAAGLVDSPELWPWSSVSWQAKPPAPQSPQSDPLRPPHPAP
jgi:REP element-mobilizing transposase RayT